MPLRKRPTRYYTKMKLGQAFVQLAILALLAATLFIPSVFASGSVTATTSPSNLAPDGINSLTVSGNALIGSVIVQGPDGTNYTSTAKCTSSNPCLATPNPVVLNFGTSVSGWHVTRVGTGCPGYTPVKGGPASTHCGGDYEYHIEGINGTSIHNVTIFKVSTGFTVPEFPASVLVMVSVSLVAVALGRRLIRGRSVVSV